jgi:hypothetical protein
LKITFPGLDAARKQSHAAVFLDFSPRARRQTDFLRNFSRNLFSDGEITRFTKKILPRRENGVSRKKSRAKGFWRINRRKNEFRRVRRYSSAGGVTAGL